MALARSRARRLLDRVQRDRAVVVVTLAAAALRLAWNLLVHRPTSFAFSDMGGYLERAKEIFDDAARAHTWFGANWRPRPHTTLFPWGTHALVFFAKLPFGRDARAPVDAAFALLGAAGVGYTYAAARRLAPDRPWLTTAFGALLVVYYPWIALSGYALSEPGLAAGVGAAAFYALRLADRGRARDAIALGAAIGVGAIFRPQMLLSGALVALVFVLRRRSFPRVGRRALVLAALPLALCLGVSSARIAFHNRRLGLVSTNGPLNFAFGRCHAPALEQRAPGSAGFFGPPPFGMMLAYEKTHPGAWFKLEPVVEKLSLHGYMWDEAPLDRMARACVEKSGLAKQASFAITHVVMLWAYDDVWPDAATGFRREMARWARAVLVLQPLPLLFALARSLRRRRARELLVAAHVFALLATAMIYFGDARMRVPYDGVAWLLAVVAAASALRWLRAEAPGLLRSGP